MILTTSLLVAVLGGTGTFALPVSRSQRDAEVFTEALGPWVTECQAQSGGQYCVELAYNGVRALGPSAAVCAQQDIADTMISFAGKLSNRTTLVNLTKTYAQQARSSADGLSVLYCQDTPAATELRGIYPCQSADYDLTRFTGGVAIGAAGTIPFGLTAAVTPAGSCPDHPGPIPSGEFITDSASKVATSKAKSKSHKSTGKHMTLTHTFSKRDEEGGETISEEGSTEDPPASEDPADPPADDSNPDATSTETSEESQPTDAPPDAPADPNATETTSASAPPSSPTPPAATPSTSPAQQPIVAIAPGSPQATAMSEALVSMTNALASASNAVSQAACGISEAAKAIAKIAAALVQQPSAAPPPAPTPSPPCPESSSAPAPTPSAPAPTDAPPKNGEGDPNAPAPTGAPDQANPSSTEGGEQPTSTADGTSPSPTEGGGENQQQDPASSDPRGPQPEPAAEQGDGGDGGEGGDGGDE